MQILEQIERGLAQLPVESSEALARKCLIYIEQLTKWNKAYNLTAIRDPNEMVTRHILDSLAIAPYISGAEIIDVGSGAGLPGIPLSILFPDKKFLLLDSSGKKTRFMTHAAITLDLKNVNVVQSRVEDYQEKRFDHVVCRAFASLSDISGKVIHLLNEDGTVLAMKGKEDTSLEIASALEVGQISSYKVPMLDVERQLVELKQARAII